MAATSLAVKSLKGLREATGVELAGEHLKYDANTALFAAVSTEEPVEVRPPDTLLLLLGELEMRCTPVRAVDPVICDRRPAANRGPHLCCLRPYHGKRRLPHGR